MRRFRSLNWCSQVTSVRTRITYYFSTPTEKEQKLISDFRTAVDSFVERLRSNEAFKDAILTHPWIATPDEHTEEILEDPEYLSSMVVFCTPLDGKSHTLY